MNTLDNNEDCQLWRKVAPAAGENRPREILPPNLIAAYLDGAASEEEISQVEQAMANDPAFLDEIIELRHLQLIEQANLSQSARATMLNAVLDEMAEISFQAKSPASAKRGYLEWMEAAAGVAAVLMASFLGYKLGQDTINMDRQVISIVAEELSQNLDEEIDSNDSLKLYAGEAKKEGVS